MHIIRVSLLVVTLATAPVLWAESNIQTSQDNIVVGSGVEIAAQPTEEAAVEMGVVVEAGNDAVVSVYEPPAGSGSPSAATEPAHARNHGGK